MKRMKHIYYIGFIMLLVLSISAFSQRGSVEKPLPHPLHGYKLLFHDQPTPLIPPELQAIGIGQGINFKRKTTNNLGVNIYYNPKLIDKGHILSEGENICAGDRIALTDDAIQGEWFPKGGPIDSPPIEFYPDLNEIKNIADTSSFKMYNAAICSERLKGNKFCQNCVVNANVFCSLNCNDHGETFDVGLGENQIGFDCNMRCAMYIEPADDVISPLAGNVCRTGLPTRPLATQSFSPSFADLNFTTGEFAYFDFSLSYNGVQSSERPHLEMVSHSYNTEENILFVKIKNTGGTSAIIDSIYFDADSKIIYAPVKIEIGKTAEILVSVDILPTIMTIEYRAAELGCLDKRGFEQTFYLGNPCSSDKDCKTNQICCGKECHLSDEGICDDTNRDGIPDTWVLIKT